MPIPPTNAIFKGPNDLVVDTASMIDLGVPNLRLAADPHMFETGSEVWHCNYFRQDDTIKYIETHSADLRNRQMPGVLPEKCAQFSPQRRERP